MATYSWAVLGCQRSGYSRAYDTQSVSDATEDDDGVCGKV